MNQIKIRVPDDAKAFLEAETALNASTQNSEVVRCIRERMARKAATGQGVDNSNPAAVHQTTARQSGHSINPGYEGATE